MRTTPALLGLFSLVTLFANRSAHRSRLPVRQSAWYTKRCATFSDALAVVRQQCWHEQGFLLSHAQGDVPKPSQVLWERITQALCYATA